MTRRRLRDVITAFVVVVFVALPVMAAEPWQIWLDPGVQARVPESSRTIMTSSACPNGCAFDRHSRKDSRFIRVIDGEGVIFEHQGPGVVTRIWMTQGDGVSRELERHIRLRVRVDDRKQPVVDLSLADLFSGKVSPFETPLVLDRRRSGGGNVSYVPIPFEKACRITLVGAESAKIWFQVTAMVGQSENPAASFSGTEDYSAWRRMLALDGNDPWPTDSGWPTVSGELALAPGERWRIAELEQSGQITGIRLQVPRQRWPAVKLHLIFNGVETVSMPLPWFFGVSGPGCDPMNGLFIAVSSDELSTWFPMPFSEGAAIDLELSDGSAEALDMRFSVRWSNRQAAEDAGIFHAEPIDLAQLPGTSAARLFELSGATRLAGLTMTSGSVDAGTDWSFLEGDEVITTDGTVSWRGTGVEDFFNGGFYFRNDDGEPEPVQNALAGLTCVRGTPSQPNASLYRLMPTDGPIAQSRLAFDWEGGRTGELPVRWRGVVWYYRR